MFSTHTAEVIESLNDADRFFRMKGAVAYHDEYLPSRNELGFLKQKTHFSRNYFNIKGQEIGMVHPEFLRFHRRVQVYDPPRVWGFAHDMIPFEG
jgi:hypothetical protein